MDARLLTSADADVDADVKAELKNHMELRPIPSSLYTNKSIETFIKIL